MLLRVNQSASFWGYGSLWFTFADPEPQNIDLSTLPADTVAQVKAAIRQGILIDMEAFYKPPKANTASAVPVVSMGADSPSDEIPPMLVGRIENLLKGTVATIKREVALIKNPKLLALARDLETASKARSMVIEAIEKRLEVVLSSPAALRGGRNPYDDAVVESEVETIKIGTAEIGVTNSTVAVPLDEVLAMAQGASEGK